MIALGAGYRISYRSMDLRPGGEWRFTMHGADGRIQDRIDFIEVTKPSRLVYRHRDAGEVEPVRFHVTVTFAHLGGKTLLTMRALSENAEELVRIAECLHGTEVSVVEPTSSISNGAQA